MYIHVHKSPAAACKLSLRRFLNEHPCMANGPVNSLKFTTPHWFIRLYTMLVDLGAVIVRDALADDLCD